MLEVFCRPGGAGLSRPRRFFYPLLLSPTIQQNSPLTILILDLFPFFYQLFVHIALRINMIEQLVVAFCK